jgi:hypothetical protein
MPLVTELFAFVAVADGAESDDEGIMAFMSDDGIMIPMIGADLERVEQLKPIARSVAKRAGCSYKILTFALSGERTKT